MAVVVVPLGPAQMDVVGVRAGDRNMIAMAIHVGGAPLDLTGYTITSQVRIKRIDMDPAMTAVWTTTDAAAGKGTLAWPGDDVAALLGGAETFTGVWDLQLASGTADPWTIAAGKWSAELDVTRP